MRPGRYCSWSYCGRRLDSTNTNAATPATSPSRPGTTASPPIITELMAAATIPAMATTHARAHSGHPRTLLMSFRRDARRLVHRYKCRLPLARRLRPRGRYRSRQSRPRSSWSRSGDQGHPAGCAALVLMGHWGQALGATLSRTTDLPNARSSLRLRPNPRSLAGRYRPPRLPRHAPHHRG